MNPYRLTALRMLDRVAVPDSGLRFSQLSPLMVSAYRKRRIHKLCVAAALRLEGGQFYSGTLRQILQHYHDVRVGAYSYGQCMIPGAFPAGVRIGRYVSVGPGVQVYLRNHPMERLSLHPFFYNPHLGMVAEDTIPAGTLEIEHDAWIGASVIVTPGCSRIGLGAVVGAGAVVTRDVPNFSVVVGNPARHLRFRFSEEARAVIEASKWWELRPQECTVHLKHMVTPLPPNVAQHPLLRSARLPTTDAPCDGWHASP